MIKILKNSNFTNILFFIFILHLTPNLLEYLFTKSLIVFFEIKLFNFILLIVLFFGYKFFQVFLFSIFNFLNIFFIILENLNLKLIFLINYSKNYSFYQIINILYDSFMSYNLIFFFIIILLAIIFNTLLIIKIKKYNKLIFGLIFSMMLLFLLEKTNFLKINLIKSKVILSIYEYYEGVRYKDDFYRFGSFDYNGKNHKVNNIEAQLLDQNIKLTNFKNIFFVNLESLGFSNNNEYNNFFIKQINNNKYRLIHQYYIPKPRIYKTLESEFRELCNFTLNIFMLKNIDELFDTIYKINDPEIDIKNCLPLRLKEYKFNTNYYHTASINYRFRLDFLNILNFNRKIFLEDIMKFNQINDNKIDYFLDGSWPSYSDLDFFKKKIINDIEEDNHSSKSKNFYYFMTTNTHLPISSRFSYKCNYEIFEIKKLCKYYDLHIQLIKNILKYFENKEKTIIIFFSDHPPNFLNNRINKLFNYEKIPYYVFIN